MWSNSLPQEEGEFWFVGKILCDSAYGPSTSDLEFVSPVRVAVEYWDAQECERVLGWEESWLAWIEDYYQLKWFSGQWMKIVAPPPVPAVNWSNAPAKATHHAYGPYGDPIWVEIASPNSDVLWYYGANVIDANRSLPQLPIGIDWRETLQPRPE